MIIINNTIQVKKGFADKLLARFDRPGNVESFEGFIGLEILLKKDAEEYDEVVVSTKWESKEAHDKWAQSDEFKKSHSGPKPDFILGSNGSHYEVVISRNPN